MSRPERHADPDAIVSSNRVFFVTAVTWGHRNVLQSDRMASLLVEVLYHYRSQSKYRVHEFVVMRDHFHALLSVGSEITIERAVQLIKGGFSYRAARELGFAGEIWQRGFSEVRILTNEQYLVRRTYLRENPVRAGMAAKAEDHQYSSARPGYELDPPPFAGAEARALAAGGRGTTEVVP